MAREIVVDWTTASGAGKATVFCFLEGTAVATQRNAVDNMFEGMAAYLHTSTSWVVRTSGREFDPATGDLVGAWTDATTESGVGTSTGEPVPDASQVLIRWATGDVVDGRFLQGRTFVPGLDVGHIDNGNMSAAAVTAFTSAVTASGILSAQLAIWHRPLKDPVTHVITRPGSTAGVESFSIWSELAVLRRRRN